MAKIELKYDALLKQHNITEAELPSAAKTAISAVKNALKGVALQEGKGRTASPATVEKITTNDGFACSEIEKYVTEKGKSSQDAQKKAEEERIAAEKKKAEESKEPQVDPKGVKIDEEIVAAIKANKTELTLDELKTVCPTTYSAVFDSYKENEDNGLETSFYKAIENKESKKFNLSKI